MSFITLFALATVPIWIGVLRLRVEVRERRSQAERHRKTIVFRHLDGLGNELASDLYVLHGMIGPKALESPKRCRKVARSTPADPPRFAIQTLSADVAERMSALAVGVELGMLPLASVHDACGAEAAQLVHVIRNLVRSLDEEGIESHEGFHRFAEMLQTTMAERANEYVDA